MRTFFSFLLTLVASMIVSQFVAQMLAIQFKSREEFIAVMALLFLFAMFCIVVFALVYAFAASTVVAVNRAALVLAAFAVMATFGGTLFGMSQSHWAWPAPDELKLIAELLFPALIAVVVQWWLVRRRSKRTST